MTLKNSLTTWAALRAPVVKPRTRDYHQELIGCIFRNWPGMEDVDVLAIAEPAVLEFIERIEHLSATRYNGILTMLKAVLPAAKNLRRRRIRMKDRPLLSQLEFSRLLQEARRPAEESRGPGDPFSIAHGFANRGGPGRSDGPTSTKILSWCLAPSVRAAGRV